MEKIRICPKCRKRYNTFPAISRKDNKTEICSECGQKEAIEQWVSARLVQETKKYYPAGTRIQLLHMANESDAVEDGTYGTVEHIDDIGTIHCRFDNGRCLGIIPSMDSFRKVENENN